MEYEEGYEGNMTMDSEPSQTGTPPKNGLFNTDAAPQVQIN